MEASKQFIERAAKQTTGVSREWSGNQKTVKYSSTIDARRYLFSQTLCQLPTYGLL